MLTHKTNVLLNAEDHQVLDRLSKKHKISRGSLIRHALKQTYRDSFQTISSSKDALKRILRCKRANPNHSSAENIRELIDHGRKY